MSSDYTERQARAQVPASQGYAATIARLTPDEREGVRRGSIRLSRLHKGRKPLTDAALDKLVAQDPDRVLAALDRYSTPAILQAAE
jgi:hypothetical protein